MSIVNPRGELSEAEADLHIHSDISSEGGVPPEKILEYASEKGLRAIALAEHDKIAQNIDYLVFKGKEIGLEVIIAVEISAIFSENNKKLHTHILGYHINPKNKLLNDTCAEIFKAKDMRCKRIINRLKKEYDLDIDFDAIYYKYGKNISRSLIAREMVERKLIKNYQDAFRDKRFFGVGGKCYVELNNPLQIEDAIKLIRNAGGIPILSHPTTLKEAYKKRFKIDPRDEHHIYDRIIPRLVENGLMGFEFVNAGTIKQGQHDAESILKLISYMEKYGLLITGGSDAHDLDEIGSVHIPYEYVERLNWTKKQLDNQKVYQEKL